MSRIARFRRPRSSHHALRDRLVLEDGVSADDFAAREGVTASCDTRLLRLAYLAPGITAAILEGRQPIDWTEQRAKRIIPATPHRRPTRSQHSHDSSSQACVGRMLSSRRSPDTA